MNKYLLLVFALISTLGFSQQNLKRITENSDYVIVEIFNFRNGDNNSVITGTENFADPINWGGATGGFSFKDTEQNVFLSPFQGNQLTIAPNLNENVCSTNYTSLHFYQNEEKFDWRIDETTQYQYQIDKGIVESRKIDTNNDGLFDCYILICKIPKKLINGTNIPTTNLSTIIVPLTPAYSCGTGFCYFNANLFRMVYNGSTWVLSNTWFNGNNYDIPQDLCGSLSNYEIEILDNKVSIYPNPTNNFITIQNKENSTENFDYKILDLTGRIVKSGNSKFNEQISIESLESGNYIIQIQTNSNEIISQKIVKN